MKLTRTAPAKINLTLEVLGRREDGYHEVRSVMQAISLHDVLTFEADPHGGLTLTGDVGVTDRIEQNLVYRAARLLRERAGSAHGTAIDLKKWIPTGAGLGGGSSDAATALMALNELWGCGLSTEDLMALGTELGSDVPFFMTGGTALALGRGERLEQMPSPAPFWLVVAKPNASLPTGDVYAEYARHHGGADSSVCRGGMNRSAPLIAALEQSARVSDWGTNLWNDLQYPALHLCPEMAELKAFMEDAHPAGVLVSGSGSAIFALAHDEQDAIAQAETLDVLGYWSEPCHAVSLPYEETE